MIKDKLVIEELKKIADNNNGILRAEDVVNAAKNKSSVLHSKFQWDDTEAAYQYRIFQARQLIRITVEFTGQNKDLPLSRVFVSLSGDRLNDGGGYRSIVSIMNDPDKKNQMLRDAVEELRSIEKKYASLKELVRVFEAIEEINVDMKIPIEQKQAGLIANA